MENAIINKIKTEIERLKEHTAKCGYPGQDEFADGNREGRNFICDKLLSFLSTLESEKPMNLGERIGSYNIVPYIDDKIAALQDMWREEKVAFDWDDMHEMIEDVARHFYDLGCRRTAEKYDEIEYNRQRAEESVPKDLEEHASRAGFDYVDNIVQEHPGHRFNDHDVEYAYRDAFIAGAKWDRSQMMQEAVEGTVMDFSSNQPRPQVDVYVDPNKYCTGDKVRIIIVKEEENGQSN